MKVVLLFFTVLAVAAAAPAIFDPELDIQWVTFAKTYGKVYKPEEETFRRVLWEKNLRGIRQHNLEADMGLHTFTMGINEHADLSDEEFRVLMKGYTGRTNNSTASSTYLPPSNTAVPSMVDWRKHGYVTPIKDQKQCGSCWAFSATGSLEGQHFKKTGKLVSLSEQDLVDCSRAEGDLGCGGGLMDNAFDYIKKKGIATEAEYPYKAINERCERTHKMKIGATCTGHVDVQSGSESDLLSAASTVGPISVAIDASAKTFRFYKHGVYYSTKCSSSRLDHGVLVVGYGAQDGMDYWLVKNSWGATWGDHGYIMMSRNRHNNCGIATQASYPLV